MLKSDYIVVKLSDVLENMEILSTTQGDEYECITIENLKGLSNACIKDAYESVGYFGGHFHIEDIIVRAKYMGYECSEEQAMDIAATIMTRHDCEYGITWDTIEYGIEEVFKIKEDGK